MNIFSKVLTTGLIMVSCISLYSQPGLYSDQQDVSSGGVLNMKSDILNNFDIKEGKVIMKADLGEDFTIGNAIGAGRDFGLDITFNVLFNNGGTNVASFSYAIRLDNDNPEGVVVINLKDYIDNANNQTGLTFNNISAANIVVTPDPSKTYSATAQTMFRLLAGYKVNYGIDATSGNGITSVSKPVKVSGSDRRYRFSWDASGIYPNYQFQLLRLYNTGETTISTEESITTDIDWTKATTIETESDLEELVLTIAEGTGFYVWRVRPIGTYAEGGIANDANWGSWNTGSPANTDGLALTRTGVSSNVNYIYFDDPDDDRNYIYSRTFTEGNKVSESATYATSLQQVKQTQVFLPSKNTKLVTQTVLDNSGRPALTTMPVPVDGGINDYEEQFVKTESGELYKAKHYDEDGNLYSPERVEDATTPFAYYSDNNSDVRIDDAEGYAFSRTVFENDGSGRIKEQSGVGKIHMLGDQSEGMGRTVRTIYSTPSRDELVAMFGDEAPDHNKVQKIITYDQNNTASVSYRTVEGNVIATALTFTDQDNTDVFEPLENEPTNAIRVRNSLNINLRKENGFESSKRLSFTQSSILKLDYKIKCQVLEGLCVNTTLDCGYMLKVTVRKLEDNSVLYEEFANLGDITDENPGGIDCSEDGYKYVELDSFMVDSGTYLVEKELLATGNINAKTEDAQDRIDAQIKPLSDWITSTLEQVQCEEELWLFYNDLHYLAGILTDSSLVNSTPWTFDCSDCSQTDFTFPSDFVELYKYSPEDFGIWLVGFLPDGTLDIIPLDQPLGDSQPVYAYITTSCCDILLNIQYTPAFKCVDPNTISATYHTNADYANIDTDYLRTKDHSANVLDYEGYAISMIKECFGTGNITDAKAQDILYQHMQGWKTPGTFNHMVYHMVTDTYCCDKIEGDNSDGSCGLLNTPDDAGTTFTGVGYDTDCEDGSNAVIEGAQYQCSQLAACWQMVVMDMLYKYCPSMSTDFTAGGAGSISEGVDEQNEDDGETHDDYIDDAAEEIPDIVEWIVENKLSKTIREEQDVSNGGSIVPPMQRLTREDHAVYKFLSCTGYKFSEILDPGNYFSGLEAEYLPNPALGQLPIGTGEYDSIPFLVNDTLGSIFPNIKDPVFAFKYFEYVHGSYRNLELQTCFVDPNECKDAGGNSVPCCTTNPDNLCNFCGKGYVTCPETYEDWDCDQRYTFYQMIKNYVEPQNGWHRDPNINCTFMEGDVQWYANNGDSLQGLDYINAAQWTTNYPGTALPSPGEFEHLDGTVNNSSISYLERIAVKQTNSCENKCSQRRGEFRAELINLLNSRCYRIEECKLSADDNVITEADLERLVDAMVAQCTSQCGITTYMCEDETCREWETPADITGETSQAAKAHLGVGGAGSADCVGGGTTLLKCNTTNDLNYAEYTFRKQAMTWVVNLDIATKCNSEGKYDRVSFTHYYDEQGNLQPTQYNAACDGNNTFVEKDEYEVTGNVGLPSDPVVSPKVVVSE